MKTSSVCTLVLLFLLSMGAVGQTVPEDFLKKYNSVNTSADKGKCLLEYFGDEIGLDTTAQTLLSYFISQNDPIGVDYVRVFINLRQNTTGEFTNSLKVAFEILSRFEERRDRFGEMWSFAALANSYATAKNYDTAIVFYRRELALAKALNEKGRYLNVINDIGYAYYQAKKPDSGIVYAKEAVKLSYQNKYTSFLLYALSTLGENYIEKREYDSALLVLRECRQYLSTDTFAVAGIFNDFAECFMGINKNDSAFYYANLVIAIASRNHLKPELLRCYENLYRFFDKLNIIDSSSKYFRLATITKDSLYSIEKFRLAQEITFGEQLRRKEEIQKKIALQNRLRFYLLLAGIIFFLTLAAFLYRNNLHKKKANELLQRQKEEIEIQRDRVNQAIQELKSAQAQLIQSEKMASLGELTAGIAHEIQNPLNFVNNFSEVSNELIGEMKQELAIGNTQQANDIADDLKQNLEKINHHGRRADAIVKGMLQHSVRSSGQRELTDINVLAGEYLRLAYHGFRAKDKNFTAEIKTDFDASIGKINIVPQDIGRVLLNLINNAFYAVSEKRKLGAASYEPRVTAGTKRANNYIEIRVEDNGKGIPQKIVDKIFQPFFTTKPTGQGTGLGLSLAYDIVKAHGGEIKVNANEREGSEMIIQLPV